MARPPLVRTATARARPAPAHEALAATRAALAVGALVLGALLAGAPLLRGQADAGGTEVVIGFDEVGAPGPFKFIVPGFDNGPLLVYPDVRVDGGVILSDVLFGNSATTDPNIYATCDTCTLGDGSGLPGVVSGVFPALVDSVSLDVINGFGGSPGTFTLTAFGLLGGVVATDSVVAAPAGSPGFVQPLSVAAPGIRSFTVTTGLSPGHTYAIDSLTFEVARSPWLDLGSGLAGAAGTPVLVGLGALAGGSDLQLALTKALANSTAWLVVGTAELNAPFKGGVLVPALDVPGFPVPLPIGPTGRLTLGGSWPAGVPSGFSVYFQHWIVDPAGPAGFSASNGVAGTTP